MHSPATLFFFLSLSECLSLLQRFLFKDRSRAPKQRLHRNHASITVSTNPLPRYNSQLVNMKFASAALIMASAGSAVASFCTPLNGCKYDTGRNLTIQPDTEFIWNADGRTGYLGAKDCSPTSYRVILPPNENRNGGSFGWKCLYIDTQ